MTLLTCFGCRLAAPLAAAALLAGCQSSRPTFQFAPAAPYLGASRPATVPTVAVAPATAAVPAVTALRPVVLPAPLRQVVRRLALRPVPPRIGTPAAPTASPVGGAPVATTVAPRLHRRLVAPARTQESGLKRIFFFFLLVFLALLAGLGALVSLIPGVSFFAGVGLAAAGLLVLFLLYSLVSGGGQKKK